MIHNPAETDANKPPDDPLVRIFEDQQSVTVVVVRNHEQRLSPRQTDQVLSALGLVSPEDQQAKYGYLLGLLGSVGVGAAALAQPEAPVAGPESKRRRTNPERQELFFTIERLLGRAGISRDELIEQLPTNRRRQQALVFFDTTIGHRQWRERLRLSDWSKVGAKADGLIDFTHQHYPSIVTAELIEPKGPLSPNREKRADYVAGVMANVMRRADIPYDQIRTRLGWPRTKMERVLGGKSHPSPYDIRALIGVVNRELERQPGTKLEEAGLRALTAREVTALVKEYERDRREWLEHSRQARRAAQQVDENRD